MSQDKRRRRAQMEFGESLMVVIVLVFLLVIGVVFYFKFAQGQVRSEIAEREDIASVTLAKRVLALPELRCGDLHGGDTCIDELKLRALGELLTDRTPETAVKRSSQEYYGKLFEYSTIKVEVLPAVDAPTSILLYNDTPPGNTTRRQQFIFTTLRDPLSGTSRLAVLNVTRHVREVR